MIIKWLQGLFKQNAVNSNLVKEAIIDYRKEGKKLMFELATKFGLDIENTEDYKNLIFRGNEKIPRRGELSKSWNYNFHGAECGFSNRKHQQRIEVVLSNPPNFGYIDSWFLLSYMQSTKKYQKEVEGVNWQELKITIERLYEMGEIKEVLKYK